MDFILYSHTILLYDIHVIHIYTCSVNLTENGKSALLQLAGGDMRRVLNLLQATHLSYEQVDEEVVYLTAGAAVPRVIEHMFQSLMNDSFLQAYNTINQVCDMNSISTISHKSDNLYVLQFTLRYVYLGYFGPWLRSL